jgi:hypothetical protein
MNNNELVSRARQFLIDIPDSKRFTWDYKQRMFAARIIKDGGLDNFLKWPESIESLHSGWTNETAQIERTLVPEAMLNIGADPEIGNPVDKKSPEGSSGTYIRQLYVASIIMSNIMPIDDIERLIEFGGGYGALAVVLNRIGFSGEHHVYDLPVLHMIRDWYLEQLDIDTHSVSDNEFDVYDLFVSVCSLDEIRPFKRELVLLNKFSYNYLFLFHRNWDGVDNMKWFADWFMSEGMAPKMIEIPNPYQALMYGSRK